MHARFYGLHQTANVAYEMRDVKTSSSPLQAVPEAPLVTPPRKRPWFPPRVILPSVPDLTDKSTNDFDTKTYLIFTSGPQS